MGHRERLKKYARFLELNEGGNCIEAVAHAAEPIFSERDLEELRTIAAEIFREAHTPPDRARIDNHSYRVRILPNCYGISVDQAATLAAVNPGIARRWRTHPRSRRYLAMQPEEYSAFERALTAFLGDGEQLAGSGGERDGLRSS